MDPREKAVLGRSGLEVTRLGLGGAPLSGMVLADGIYQGSAYDQSLKIIQRAYDLGIRYFDTAPLYGEGRSEIRYGRVLGGLERASFSISTKVSRLLIPADLADLSPYSEDGLPHYNIQFNFSRDGCSGFGVSSVGHVPVHAWSGICCDPLKLIKEGARRFHNRVAQGQIKYVFSSVLSFEHASFLKHLTN